MSHRQSIFIHELNGEGGITPIPINSIPETPTNPIWIHLDRGWEESQQWLEKSNLDDFIIEALSAEGVRPRCQAHNNGLLVVLRGVNLNPESDPDDMVSIRAWIEENRIITVRQRRIMALTDIQERLKKNEGPCNTGEFLTQLVEGLSDKMVNIVDSLDNTVDDLEECVLEQPKKLISNQISETRRQIIRLRRHMAPQREVLIKLQNEKVTWLNEENRLDMRETAESMTRYVEDLDSAKERAAIIQDSLENRSSAQMNRTMYLLSIITAVFLPLGFITGLLGINVGGIPGTENPKAFTLVCGALFCLFCVQIIMIYLIYRQNKGK
jgi:zinc transporter